MHPAWVDHGVSCADTLKRLQQRRQARAQTEPYQGKQHTFMMAGLTIAYKIMDGLLIRTDELGNILVLELPTAMNPRFHAEVRPIGFVPTDFVVDTTLDLVVFITLESASHADPETRRVSLRPFSLGTMNTHPDASSPIFYFELSRIQLLNDKIHNLDAQMAGELVGLYFGDDTCFTTRLIVWNWRTDQLIADTNHYQIPGEPASFCFVSPTLICAPMTGGSSAIMLYSLNPSVPSSGFKHIATLVLPRRDTRDIYAIKSYSEPFRCKMSLRTFDTVPQKRFHVFSVESLEAVTFDTTSHILCTPSSLFLDLRELCEQVNSTTPVVFAWDRWGPLTTRCFPISTPHNFARHVYGQRILLPVASKTIKLLDFNTKIQTAPLMPPTFVPVGDSGSLWES